MASAYQAARHTAAFIDRSSRGRIVVNGRDRASYLQGLLTNDIEALKTGEGCYAAYLTAQGRMIADLWVYELGDVIMLSLAGELTCNSAWPGSISSSFPRTCSSATSARPSGRSLSSGRTRRESWRRLFDEPPVTSLATLPEHGNLRGHIGQQPAIVTRVTDTGEPGFDVYVERGQLGWLNDRLIGRRRAES